jgi:hemoglobin/transferrin/lactoferrin receptor protein
MKFYILICFLITTILLSSPVFPDDQVSGPHSEVLTLQGITVTATRTERELMQVPISVSYVDETQIELDPKNSVAEQLKNTPGVYIPLAGVNQGSSQRNRVMIRGFDQRRIIVLIDNIRQNFPATLNAGGEFAIDTSEIENIEVIKGPASVLYGSDAIGGVVKITTKKGGDKPIGATVKTMFSSVDRSYTPYVAIYGEKNGFYYRVSGTGADKGNQRLYGGEVYRHSESSFQDYLVKFGYKWDAGEIDFSAEHFVSKNNEVEEEGDSLGYVYQKPEDKVTHLSNKYYYRDSYTISYTQNNITELFKKFTLRAFLQELEDGWITKEVATNLETYNSDELNRSYGVTAQTDWLLFDNHALSYGLDFVTDKLKLKTTAGTLRDYDAKQQTLAIFVQDEWRAFEKLSFIAGLRQTWIKMDFKKNNIGPERDGSKKYKNFVGSLGLVFRASEELALRAHFSQGYKTPSINSLYADSLRVLANPNLQPEKSNNYEIGARYDNGFLAVDAALFYSDFKGEITSKQIGPSLWESINANSKKSYGLELATNYRIGESGFTPYFELTLMKSERTYESGFKTDNTGEPTLWGRLGLRFAHDFGENEFFSNLAFRYVDDFYQAWSPTVLSRNDAQNYIDLSLGLRALTSVGECLVTLSMENLANRKFKSYVNLPSGFQSVLSVSFKF